MAYLGITGNLSFLNIIWGREGQGPWKRSDQKDKQVECMFAKLPFKFRKNKVTAT